MGALKPTTRRIGRTPAPHTCHHGRRTTQVSGNGEASTGTVARFRPRCGERGCGGHLGITVLTHPSVASLGPSGLTWARRQRIILGDFLLRSYLLRRRRIACMSAVPVRHCSSVRVGEYGKRNGPPPPPFPETILFDGLTLVQWRLSRASSGLYFFFSTCSTHARGISGSQPAK
jgi:hypothetical protein